MFLEKSYLKFDRLITPWASFSSSSVSSEPWHQLSCSSTYFVSISQNFQNFVISLKTFSYVLSLETIVDIATLPPLFVMAFTSRQWIGFRCKTYPCLIHHLWCPFYLSFLSLAILDQIWDSINHHNCPSSDS